MVVHEHFREMLISPAKISWQRAILLLLFLLATQHLGLIIILSGLEFVVNTVTNTTTGIIFSLVTKNTGLVATFFTRFLYDLDLN